MLNCRVIDPLARLEVEDVVAAIDLDDPVERACYLPVGQYNNLLDDAHLHIFRCFAVRDDIGSPGLGYLEVFAEVETFAEFVHRRSVVRGVICSAGIERLLKETIERLLVLVTSCRHSSEEIGAPRQSETRDTQLPTIQAEPIVEAAGERRDSRVGLLVDHAVGHDQVATESVMCGVHAQPSLCQSISRGASPLGEMRRHVRA